MAMVVVTAQQLDATRSLAPEAVTSPVCTGTGSPRGNLALAVNDQSVRTGYLVLLVGLARADSGGHVIEDCSHGSIVKDASQKKGPGG